MARLILIGAAIAVLLALGCVADDPGDDYATCEELADFIVDCGIDDPGSRESLVSHCEDRWNHPMSNWDCLLDCLDETQDCIKWQLRTESECS